MSITYTLRGDCQFINLVDIPNDVREDLQKLANYLWELPAKDDCFDMEYLWRTTGTPQKPNVCETLFFHDFARPVDLHCGTVACALGYAINAGICSDERVRYSQLRNHLTCENVDVYKWIFSSEWAEFDNTAKGAAIRIQILLDHGLPIGIINSVDITENLLVYASKTQQPMETTE